MLMLGMGAGACHGASRILRQWRDAKRAARGGADGLITDLVVRQPLLDARGQLNNENQSVRFWTGSLTGLMGLAFVVGGVALLLKAGGLG
ncbi:hypothetical protein KDL01_09840 [Actinospica durhamensis]|uniref:Uncharacterized protein n=1 Tax=Actinospica durhamensis TaxID=1508375 RepID=A0A941EL10_9ACTN|nr:hypothetical protein [Actinospica durhamensis]MBR7833567.1 hypothetical protein [Actinospica durhamensis]